MGWINFIKKFSTTRYGDYTQSQHFAVYEQIAQRLGTNPQEHKFSGVLCIELFLQTDAHNLRRSQQCGVGCDMRRFWAVFVSD